MSATQSLGATRNRLTLTAGAVLVVLVLVALAVLTRDRAPFSGSLDPRNPKASGAQAVARVLAEHGVTVTVVRGQDALLAQPVDARTEVVVTNPGELGPSTLQRLRTHTRVSGGLTMIGPARVLAAQLDLRPGLVPAGSRPAACEEVLARRLVVRAYGGEGLKAEGCFGESDTSLLARSHGTWLLASPASISNRHVLEEDNAALALRLLGQRERLLWYVADSADLGSEEGLSLSRLLPPWLGPSAILLVVGVLALMLLRGRRLGPLVTEPLPVVVRAVESTLARGRIYRRTGDRDHAAAILVAASRRRIGETLGLPPQTRVEAVADAAAARAGRDPRLVRELLSTTTVPTNARLTELGSRLIELENEVRAP